MNLFDDIKVDIKVVGGLKVVARTRLNTKDYNERSCKMLADHKYNAAKKTLVKAGSKSAEKSHDKHTQGKGSPQGHGEDLLRGSRDEFRESDKELPEEQKKSGMSHDHHAAIHKAAGEMGITEW
jgi:hypothetical protein